MMPMMAASGAATRPMVCSLSSELRMASSSSSTERSSTAFLVSSESSGWTNVYFNRCQRVRRGAASPPGLPASSLVATGAGYRSPGRGSFWVPVPRLGRPGPGWKYADAVSPDRAIATGTRAVAPQADQQGLRAGDRADGCGPGGGAAVGAGHPRVVAPSPRARVGP